MEARLVDTTSTARNDALARCLIAIELSKASWVVGVAKPIEQQDEPVPLDGWGSEQLA